MLLAKKILPYPCDISNGLFSNEKIARFVIAGTSFQTIVSEEFLENQKILLKVIEESSDHFLVQVPGDLVTGTRFSAIPKKEVTTSWLFQIRR